MVDIRQLILELSAFDTQEDSQSLSPDELLVDIENSRSFTKSSQVKEGTPPYEQTLETIPDEVSLLSPDNLQTNHPHKKLQPAYKILSKVLFMIPVVSFIFSVISLALGGDGGNIFLGNGYYYIGAEAGSNLPEGALGILKPINSSGVHVDDIIVIRGGDGLVKVGIVIEVVTANKSNIPMIRLKNDSGEAFSADKVIGVVTQNIPLLGSVMLFFKQNIPLVIIISALLMIAYFIINRILIVKNSLIITPPDEETAGSSSKKKMSIFFDILFYTLIAACVLIAFVFSISSSGPKKIFGYSYFIVLSTSMQSEIPKGSLVLVKNVDTDLINIGDNITYLQSNNTTITHKVIKIIENNENSGTRGFQTKGVNNVGPDQEIVQAVNVVGKVVFFFPNIGAFIYGISKNLWVLFVALGMILVLSVSLKMLISIRNYEKDSC